MKTNEGTGQLEKRLVRRGKFLPADQEPSRTIEPGEKPLHDPSSRRFTRFQTVGSLLGWLIPFMVLRIEPHMRLRASFIQLSIDEIMIVGRIQAQVLRMDDGGLWAIK